MHDVITDVISCGCSVWLTPQTVNKPQCLCVSDFVPTPDHDNIQRLVSLVNDSIDRGQLKGNDQLLS